MVSLCFRGSLVEPLNALYRWNILSPSLVYHFPFLLKEHFSFRRFVFYSVSWTSFTYSILNKLLLTNKKKQCGSEVIIPVSESVLRKEIYILYCVKNNFHYFPLTFHKIAPTCLQDRWFQNLQGPPKKPVTGGTMNAPFTQNHHNLRSPKVPSWRLSITVLQFPMSEQTYGWERA